MIRFSICNRDHVHTLWQVTEVDFISGDVLVKNHFTHCINDGDFGILINSGNTDYSIGWIRIYADVIR